MVNGVNLVVYPTKEKQEAFLSNLAEFEIYMFAHFHLSRAQILHIYDSQRAFLEMREWIELDDFIYTLKFKIRE